MATHTLVMGIVNVTPDSFADGGKYLELRDASSRISQMLSEEVDIVDIGGESTRPGATRVSEEDERARVLPVVKEALALGATVSVDTMRASVAAAAIELGVHFINDVSGGLADEKMSSVIAQSDVRYVAMHWRGHSANMMDKSEYQDVVAEVCSELEVRISALIAAGVRREQLIVDPGIGFSKLPAQNWELLRGIEQLSELGLPILIGASRKRFLGENLKPEEREEASVAVTSFCASQGVWAVRTHSVRPHKEAIAQVVKGKVSFNG
ncbi:MAG: dihydropteroate synthase [Actinobacteria bacterium]|uniref:dihydropteroate synthase n=1 Tax=freshwater metagenome TaxID=449393 RepID=A0A6J6CUR5_9ZZZZ|nr:dihydropteroate synthase [Actinomycetota bacterium]